MTRQPDEFGIAVGDRVRGRDVTMGNSTEGTVAEIIPPLRFSGQYGNRYRLVDTGETYAGGKPIEPIVECASRVVEHEHHAGCPRDAEGPTIMYLCGHEPRHVPNPGVPSAAVAYNPDSDRYERPDGTEDPGARHRRRVEESSPAAFWGDN